MNWTLLVSISAWSVTSLSFYHGTNEGTLILENRISTCQSGRKSFIKHIAMNVHEKKQKQNNNKKKKKKQNKKKKKREKR